LIKIPGGANILVNSPLTDKRSPYNQQYFLLTSNGVYAIQQGGLGVLSPPNQPLSAGSTVTFKMTLTDTFTLADLQAMEQARTTQHATWNVFFNNQLIGTIQDINPATLIVTVKLSQTINNLPSGYALDFRAAVTDPYSTQLRDLWYSWANYYV